MMRMKSLRNKVKDDYRKSPNKVLEYSKIQISLFKYKFGCYEMTYNDNGRRKPREIKRQKLIDSPKSESLNKKCSKIPTLSRRAEMLKTFKENNANYADFYRGGKNERINKRLQNQFRKGYCKVFSR
jgi:hypothetical protein